MVTDIPIKIQIVKTLTNLKPSRMIAVKKDGDNNFSLYVTDVNSVPFPLKAEGGLGTITNVTNTDGNLTITGVANKIVNLNPTLAALINTALQPGNNISNLVNNVGYITLADLPSSTAIRRADFEYTGGSQLFTLPSNYYQVFSVEVQGQGALSLSQYSLVAPNKVQINDVLNTNDYIVILYGVNLQVANVPYYTQAEVDTLIGKNRIFSEVPSGIVNGANATFTSQFNFAPGTLSVFLNGILQKIVSDYNTSLNNTINLVSSPTSAENILINYTKQ